jgi:plastocyanin
MARPFQLTGYHPIHGALPSAAALLLAFILGAAGCSNNSSPPPTPSTVTFSPATASLNNPTTSGETTSASTVSFTVTIRDSNSTAITASPSSPLTVSVHGAPAGVITPATTTITSGNTVTFAYNGGFFQHPLTVKASMPNGAGGHAIGTTQLLQSNQVCNLTDPRLLSFTLNLLNSANYLTNGLAINAAVGYNNPTASVMQSFTIDTGSLGVVVPANELGPNITGPGAPSEKYYDSSGNIYSGFIYLAPVSFQTSAGTFVSTTDIPVLGVTSTSCAPNARQCDPNRPPPNNLHYLGVGFDRNSTTPGDRAVGPTYNAFLNLNSAANGGSDIAPGYRLNGAAGQVTLGMTSAVTNGFTAAALTQNQTVPGDWNTSPGCFGFPAQSAQFCGTLLMDVGITEMFLQLVENQRPAGTTQTSGNSIIVPLSTRMSILAGSAASPIMSYQFTNGLSSDVMAPIGNNGVPNVTWAGSGSTFVNTGRRVLAGFNYLFDAQCGQVGYQALP